MKYLIGNWKANKNLSEVHHWVDAFMAHDLAVLRGQVEVIVCPSYPFIPLLNEAFADYDHIHVGAQDISRFGAGAYTGEVSAHSLQGIVDYVLIGHSERRAHFDEKDNTVDQKVQNARGADIEPIVIVSDVKAIIPDGVKFVAYEPADRIGTGNPEDTDSVVAMKRKLGLGPENVFIYGASSNAANTRDFVSTPEIDGLLPGGSSLDPEEFYSMAERCCHLTTE